MCMIPAKKKQKSVLLRACDQMLCEGIGIFLGGNYFFSVRSVAFLRKMWRETEIKITVALRQKKALPLHVPLDQGTHTWLTADGSHWCKWCSFKESLGDIHHKNKDDCHASIHRHCYRPVPANKKDIQQEENWIYLIHTKNDHAGRFWKCGWPKASVEPATVVPSENESHGWWQLKISQIRHHKSDDFVACFVTFQSNT